ncbi:dihydrofolate reductase family protein [Planctomonas psychrotolerans]|uniref:dihydrofolate reductase family protein n=1 Tax=Planctomonas psychrotolerans TaxID=2528712 RepID=UPI00123ABFAC|nr:dihydrofolate reductase family protein [Planctomonas psychrotolerans]
MGQLRYSGLISLDGYSSDAGGDFGWAMPDEEVHAAINDSERPTGTYLYGRRMYEVMAAWETMPTEPDATAPHRDFAGIWARARKVVYSRTLDTVSTERTRIERRFDPDAVRRLLESSEEDLSIGGAGVGGLALRGGLVSEVAAYVFPVTVGGGTKFLPDGFRAHLELVEERRFTSGVVLLRYRVLHGPDGS